MNSHEVLFGLSQSCYAALLAGWLKNVEQEHSLSFFMDMGVEDPSLTFATATSTSASASSSAKAKDAVLRRWHLCFYSSF